MSVQCQYRVRGLCNLIGEDKKGAEESRKVNKRK